MATTVIYVLHPIKEILRSKSYS